MPDYQSILVPLDGSAYSEQALPLAEMFAKRTGAVVHLVMVHLPAQALFAPPEVPVDMTFYEGAARQRESTWLETVARRFSADSGLTVTHQLLEGDVPGAIDQFATAQGVSLVIMTTHGRSGIARLWLGSVADKLIRRLIVPVLVVHPVTNRPVTSPSLRRILVPLDGSALSASVLEPAKALALRHGAGLVLAMVVEPLPPVMPPTPFPLALPPVSEEARVAEDHRYLDAVRNRLRDEGFRVEGRVVMGRKASKRIVELATAEHCDLIILATHGAGGLSRVLLGSVTDRVVRTASVPVLVLRPDSGARLPEPGTERVEESVSAVPSCSIR